ncbi:SMI1/KNR4 family protein [Streptomyces sp. NPDC058171]
MKPDLTQLRDLIDTVPGFGHGPAGGTREREAMTVAAEARVGPLPPSYRWWLTEVGGTQAPGTDLATVGPDVPGYDPYDLITAPWRLRGDRLRFGAEPDCGYGYSFALDRRPDSPDGELPVVCHDGTIDEEHPVAESFAGFLTVLAARQLGLGDGPQPELARLWRSTPGALLDNGVHVYGPHLFVERNGSFEVARRAPHWVLVGDDGRGGALLMRRHGRDRRQLYRLDPEALGPGVEADGEPLTDDLLGWLSRGAPLP